MLSAATTIFKALLKQTMFSVRQQVKITRTREREHNSNKVVLQLRACGQFLRVCHFKRLTPLFHTLDKIQ
jgi:hypothetical protein